MPAILNSRQAYNLISSRYENWRWYPFWRANEGPLVKSWLADKSGIGLDAACGNAPYLSDFPDSATQRILVDISEGMLEAAKKQLKKCNKKSINLIQSDIQALPIKSQQIDFAICTRAISNTSNCSAVFNELSRVLRKGGQFLITDIHPDHNYEYTAVDTPIGKIFIETYKHSITNIINNASTAGLRLIEYRSYNALALAKPPNPKDFSKIYESPETPIFFSMKFEKHP